MGWLQDRWKAVKKGVKDPGEVATTLVTGIPGLYTAVGKPLLKGIGPSKPTIGKDIEKTAKSEASEIEGIRAGMESDYEKYKGGIAGARGSYREQEDLADKGYDTQVDNNAIAAGTIEAGLATKADALENEAKDQANNAAKTYTDSVRPRMMANMESAMSLRDYMNPDNEVQKGYREMFAAQGENVRKQGMADYGILAALGGQAARGAMSGRALTGSQMAAQTQAGLGQAGAAYQRAQQRAEDLRTEGIRTGMSQADKAYEAGQAARRDFTNEEERQLSLGSKARAERQGYAREAGDLRMSGVERQADINRGRYERDTSKRGARYGEDLGDLKRDQAFKYGMSELRGGDITRRYGTQREGMIAQDAANQAREASIRSLFTAGLISGSQAAGAAQGGQQAPAQAQPQQTSAPAFQGGGGVDTTYVAPAKQRRSYYA